MRYTYQVSTPKERLEYAKFMQNVKKANKELKKAVNVVKKLNNGNTASRVSNPQKRY
jgi:hypothetical protein